MLILVAAADSIVAVVGVGSTVAANVTAADWKSYPHSLYICAFSSCLPTGTEDCAVPVVFSG